MSFSELALDHIARPRNRGELPDADLYGVAGCPGEGPYVEIWLRLDGELITAAHYDTNGCPSSVVCASLLCELAIGRELETMKELHADDLRTILGGLPEGKEEYADLAIKALQAVLVNP